MLTLPRILAVGVVEALRGREHILVAPESTGLLRDEIEQVIASALPTIAPYLVAAHAALGDASFGDETADEVVAAIVDAIGEQLMRSDHVDDIFATDVLIRRDAFRALRDILLRYLGGELRTEDDAESEGTLTVALDGLGYIASMVARRADLGTITTALARAAAEARGKLERYDAARREAVFHFAAEAGGSLLALEEAVTGAVVDLVEQERVLLPGMQQLREIDHAVATRAGFADALASAAAAVQQRTGCLATASMLDDGTMLLTLTPLSFDGAEQADSYLACLVATVEAALQALPAADAPARRSEPGPGRSPTSSSSSARRKRAPRGSTRPRASRPPPGEPRAPARERTGTRAGKGRSAKH